MIQFVSHLVTCLRSPPFLDSCVRVIDGIETKRRIDKSAAMGCGQGSPLGTTHGSTCFERNVGRSSLARTKRSAFQDRVKRSCSTEPLRPVWSRHCDGSLIRRSSCCLRLGFLLLPSGGGGDAAVVK